MKWDDNVVCPKCGHEHQSDSPSEWDEVEYECDDCGFKFEVAVSYSAEFCLSCVAHEFVPWEFPRENKTEDGNLWPDAVKCKYCGCVNLGEPQA
jgi:DNA-directed RNA polymerase subunit RPC12/RpoP